MRDVSGRAKIFWPNRVFAGSSRYIPRRLEQECLRILRDAGYRTIVVPNAWWRHFVPELRPLELNHWLVAFRSEAKGAYSGNANGRSNQLNSDV